MFFTHKNLSDLEKNIIQIPYGQIGSSLFPKRVITGNISQKRSSSRSCPKIDQLSVDLDCVCVDLCDCVVRKNFLTEDIFIQPLRPASSSCGSCGMGDRDWRPFIYGGLASITAEFGKLHRKGGHKP